jgi:hypothetical protein
MLPQRIHPAAKLLPGLLIVAAARGSDSIVMYGESCTSQRRKTDRRKVAMTGLASDSRPSRIFASVATPGLPCTPVSMVTIVEPAAEREEGDEAEAATEAAAIVIAGTVAVASAAAHA